LKEWIVKERRKGACMVLNFRGVAHPPPRRDGERDHSADLNAAEIATTNLGRGSGTKVLVEHDHDYRVGTVHSSWEGPDGSLRVYGTVTDPSAERMVRSGKMRGLSLGTSVIQDEHGGRMAAFQDELSICEDPRRGGCFIDEVDGKRVRTVRRASKKGTACR
tara:strand:+ start:21165 stop:21650 length:486 start_codon:yes stop_codon:yes gene_type:complete